MAPFRRKARLGATRRGRWLGIGLGACLSAAAEAASGLDRVEPGDPSLAALEERVAIASAPTPPWDGPRTGPPGSPGKRVAIVSEDLRNGGVLGVALGVREAAEVMGWTLEIFDAGGTVAGRGRAVAGALAAHPDGVILVGADAGEMASLLQPFAHREVPVVGWHVGPRPGPLPEGPVAVNVSTDPLEVARVAAGAAVLAADGPVGVVIFTDHNFEIALAKSRAMAEVVRACGRCELLEVRDVSISASPEELPAVTRQLLARHGARWTHALAINDIYFDYAVPQLIRAEVPADRIRLYSAGDGSSSAFIRIHAGLFQMGTVAEPLNLHGWQLVDELNRLLAGEPVSGYVVPVRLITRGNVAFDGGQRLQYDPANGYRDAYRRIWKR